MPQAAMRYILTQGVKSCTGPPSAMFARISALGSPRSSPDADPVAKIASIR